MSSNSRTSAILETMEQLDILRTLEKIGLCWLIELDVCEQGYHVAIYERKLKNGRGNLIINDDFDFTGQGW